MTTEDAQAIRELVEDRALWRDAGEWERFATVRTGNAVERLYAEGAVRLAGSATAGDLR
jgi:hypothetical protein